ncbi:MAG: hypothetical protein ABH821_03415 [archaeon]
MDETTFRILSVLTSELGSNISINLLTRKIKERFGTGFYKNIYDKTKELEKQEILSITEIGKSSIIGLNYKDYLLTDILTEMELKRKKSFTEKNNEIKSLLIELENNFNGFYTTESILIVNSERNMRLNKAEFLFLLRTPGIMIIGEKRNSVENKKQLLQSEIECIHSMIKMIAGKLNLRIDYLILENKEFLELLKSDENNSLKEMLADKIVLTGEQAFWTRIRIALKEGNRIKVETKEINPAKISEKNLAFNLNRFGYKEAGITLEQGQKVCLEKIVTAILLQGNARRIEAIPVLLSKNKTIYNLLIFLSRKYGKLSELLGLLKALNKLTKNEAIKRETGKTINLLEQNFKVKEKKFDLKSIKQKMVLYNAN